MPRGRGDRPGLPGLRLASGSGDLIEDIHRQQRRRTLKRAAQLVALAIALLLIGVAIKIFLDRQSKADALEEGYAHFAKGTPGELDKAIGVLQDSIDGVAAEDPPTLVARALVRVHRRAELGEGDEEARQAVDAVPGSPPGLALARGLLEFADGELEAAAESLAADRAVESELPPGPFVLDERAWLHGMLAVARTPDDAEALAAAVSELQARLAEQPEQVSLRRVLALAHLVAGQTEPALTELQTAREQGRPLMGLAADEALYNAYLRQKLSGVASVADQLLEGAGVSMSPHDRAHAQLARAVVHVHSGEVEDGLRMLDLAWEGLPAWDRLSRRLAIQSALEAGDLTLALNEAESALRMDPREGAYLLLDMDDAVRRIMTAVHIGLLDRDEKHRRMDQIGHVCRRVFACANSYVYLELTREAMQQHTARAAEAVRRMGELPPAVLSGDLRDAFAPDRRRSPPSDDTRQELATGLSKAFAQRNERWAARHGVVAEDEPAAESAGADIDANDAAGAGQAADL